MRGPFRRGPGEEAPQVAFVLSGGANLGAIQAGQALALLEAGIRPDVIVGCSVGAINGAFLAADPTAERARELAEAWKGVKRDDVFGKSRRQRLVNVVMRRDHVYEARALRALIRRFVVIDGAPLTDLSQTRVPLHVVTTDLDGGAETWWSEGPLEDVLAASACIPGAFPPVRLGDSLHVDGGVLAPVPVHRAVELGAKVTYVLDVSGRDRAAAARRSALEVLVEAFAISRYARMVEHGAGPGQVVVPLPRVEAGVKGINDFSRCEDLVQAGYDSARDFLAAHQAQGPGRQRWRLPVPRGRRAVGAVLSPKTTPGPVEEETLTAPA